jgi:hypothetical protein
LGQFHRGLYRRPEPRRAAGAADGRFHYDFADSESDEGDNSEWNVRRLRIGPRITFFKKFLLHSEVELDPQRHNPSTSVSRFLRSVDQKPQIVLTVGKQGAPFTLDGANSSRELLTIDRSNLANNMWFPMEYLPGVSCRADARRGSIAQVCTPRARRTGSSANSTAASPRLASSATTLRRSSR